MSTTLSVTVLGLGGEPVWGPIDLDQQEAVRSVRSKVLSLQPDYHEVIYPWCPDVRIEVALLLQDQDAVLEDHHVLDGPSVQLTCVIKRMEEPRSVTLDDVIAEIEAKCAPAKCLGLYVQGSWLSQYKTPGDVDLYAVVEEQGCHYCDDAINIGDFHICCFTLEDWIGKLHAMDPSILPCLSLPNHFVLKRLDDARMYNVKIDIPLLKQSVLAFADVKWLSAVIGGLKTTLDWCNTVDMMACKKVYFAFRALEIGCQLAKDGRISDFSCAAEWYSRACCAASFLGVQDRPEGFDLVQVLFASDFQKAVDRFGMMCGDTASSSTRPEQLICRICGHQLMQNSSAYAMKRDSDVASQTCCLANCGHAVHLRCIAQWIKKNYQQVPPETIYGFRDECETWLSPSYEYGYYAYGTCFVPEPACPVCTKLSAHNPGMVPSTIRLCISEERLANRLKMMNGRALDGTNARLFLPYFDMCVHRLFCYRVFEKHGEMKARCLEAASLQRQQDAILGGGDLATDLKDQRGRKFERSKGHHTKLKEQFRKQQMAIKKRGWTPEEEIGGMYGTTCQTPATFKHLSHYKNKSVRSPRPHGGRHKGGEMEDISAGREVADMGRDILRMSFS